MIETSKISKNFIPCIQQAWWTYPLSICDVLGIVHVNVSVNQTKLSITEKLITIFNIKMRLNWSVKLSILDSGLNCILPLVSLTNFGSNLDISSSASKLKLCKNFYNVFQLNLLCRFLSLNALSKSKLKLNIYHTFTRNNHSNSTWQYQYIK